ncbi:hypothetical protein [Pontibacter burrus]|uniref:Carboxypeptidase regulatory-like domain-containing protein n=1 Tax=Pontibacter burrus TaxID=2704466 RepID=A0A6B3LMD8_9BACT|nr:hypothetical protein [Pontibacter burrus]NEM97123.1 hypothetical protein [Pontibacter burrus]
MKNKLFLLLPLLLLLLSSCHTQTDDFISKHCPGSCTVIKGKLTTDDRSTPLAGVKLEVNWVTRDIFSSLLRRKAITTTDANGNFELRFLLREDELVRDYNNGVFVVNAQIDQSKYLGCRFYEHLLTYDKLSRDTTIIVNYNLPHRASLYLQALNTSAMSTGDAMLVSAIFDYGEAGPAPNCIPTVSMDIRNTEAAILVAANQDVIIRTVRRKNGVETTTNEVVRLTPGQNLHHQLSF